MKLLFTFCLSICLLIVACEEKPSTSQISPHPMVDGRNTEYADLSIEPIPISEDVNLYLFQNDSYVWISYDFPEGSYGTLDLILKTDTIQTPLNIHVSAQLGEWLQGDESNIPKTATSDLWWNHKGWIANPLWANGIDTVTYDTPEFKLRNGEVRELQLSKNRFGRGTWKFRLHINAIKNAKGEFYSVKFPNNQTFYEYEVQ